MNQAFVLGAGLGTRLRPLTDLLPKPLIPVGHRPLVTWAFDHLRHSGVQRFVVNTHHLPARWQEAFPSGTWKNSSIIFNHEPVLLETGGGLADAAAHLRDEPFIVYNGDILTDLPLEPALSAHRTAGNLVTLILRSTGDVRNVAFVRGSGQVIDLRNKLGTDYPEQFQFTGLYVVDPAFLKYVQHGVIESVVPAFLRAIQAGERIGGVVTDEGQWRDLGDRGSYLAAHHALAQGEIHNFGTPNPPIHPDALVAPDSEIIGSWIGPGAVVESGVRIVSSVLWPGSTVRSGAVLEGCIVRTGCIAAGKLAHADV